MSNEFKIEIECPDCGQEIKIKPWDRIMDVACHNCNAVFEVDITPRVVRY